MFVKPTEIIANLRVADIDEARSFSTDFLGLDEESFNLGWVAHFRTSDGRAAVPLVTKAPRRCSLRSAGNGVDDHDVDTQFLGSRFERNP